jgi:hypothetical protein
MPVVSASHSPAGTNAVEAAADYLASETHYLSVAGRILPALRGEGGFVLVTGDPMPDPQLLSQALRKLADGRYRVIGIPCGPQLTTDAVSRAGSVIAGLPAGGETATLSDTAETTSALLVFEEAHRLADAQIEEICASLQRDTRQIAVGVLLAHLQFLVRLEGPSLQVLRDALTVRLRFDEIGDDEAIDFLRHQLAVRQSQGEESPLRPIILRGLAVLGVLVAVGMGVSLAIHYVEMPNLLPGDRSVPSMEDASPGVAPPLQPVPARTTPSANAPPEVPKPPKAPTVPPLTAPAPITPAPLRPGETPRPNTSGATPPAPGGAMPAQTRSETVEPSAHQRLSPAEIAALVTRGDTFLSAGDFASARLFYERAADAGDGAAALRLGATFDPNFLGRAGVRGNPADPAQAASWYRRARDLGDSAAAERLKNLDQRPR